MSSTYAPLPFSYLAGGSQPPKTGFRRDDGLYGSRRDMAQPIPALRHDQPRIVGDWSIGQRLRGGDSSPKPERRRPTPHDSGDTESVLSHCSDVRQPRPDVSLYQSQITGPTFGSSPVMVDTPSGHYSNRPSNDVDDVGHVDDTPPTVVKPHGVGGVLDNFILKGPGIQRSRTDVGARRTEDERPTPTSRLEQLFDDQLSTLDAAPTRRLDSDTAGSRPPHTSENAGRCDDGPQLPSADETTNNSYIVTTSRSTSFCIGDTKLTERSSATDSEAACTQCCCCCGSSGGVYCSRCRLCVLVGTAVFVALLMCGVGFVAGWFAYHLQHHPAAGSLAPEGNATASTWPGQTESLTTTVVTAATSTRSSATTSAANSTTAPVSQPSSTNATTATTTSTTMTT